MFMHSDNGIMDAKSKALFTENKGLCGNLRKRWAIKYISCDTDLTQKLYYSCSAK